MSTAKLPTRSRPDDGRFRGGRLRLVEGVCHPDPPPAPAHLSKREKELFRQAWREPESTLRADLLEWWLASGRPGDDAVVIPRPSDGGTMSARSFNAWRGAVFAPALEAARLPHARPYDLRHSFASLLLHEGRSVVYVARQLGHSAKVCLEDYGHVIDELEDTPQLRAEQAIRRARLAATPTIVGRRETS